MGAGGVTNHGTYETYDHKINPIGKPNSKVIKKDKNGKIKQIRWYDKEGKAARNRDFSDNGGTAPNPHDHNWSWKDGQGYRDKNHSVPDYRYN